MPAGTSAARHGFYAGLAPRLPDFGGRQPARRPPPRLPRRASPLARRRGPAAVEHLSQDGRPGAADLGTRRRRLRPRRRGLEVRKELAIEQERLALLAPRFLVGARRAIALAGLRLRVVHPFP